MLFTLDRYLLRQMARPMMATILIALLALLAERALKVVDLVLGWRGSLVAVFEMLSYLIPHYMGFALPAAFFLGILFAFSRLSREGELDAMASAGFGLARMARPMLGAALVVALLHFALVSYLQPYSRYAYRAAVHAVTNVSFIALLEPGRFVTFGDSTFRVGEVSDSGERFARLFLFADSPETGAVTITARAGEVETADPMDPLVLNLEQGVHQMVPSAEARAGNRTTPRAVTLRFERFTTDLSGTEPEPFRPRGDDEREMTLPELWQALDDPPEAVTFDDVSAEFHTRVVRILSILFLPCLAMPLALGRRRMQRSYGTIIGIVVLVIYNQLVDIMESFVDDGQTRALTGLWLPFFVFALGSTLLFVRAAWKVPDVSRGAALDRLLEQALARILRLYPRRRAA